MSRGLIEKEESMKHAGYPARGCRAAGGERRMPDGNGGVAQMGERLLCTQEVVGSIPSVSTKDRGL